MTQSLALFTLVWLASATCAAQTPTRNPFSSDPKAAESGRAMFRIYCSPCHGIRAEGGRGPDLTRGVYSAGELDEDLFKVISEGATGTEMPPFGFSLGTENVWRLVSYIRSIARPDVTPITGDRVAGEKLFWSKGGCGQCHRVNERGGRMGPDLTRVGRLRSLAYLRESITSPDNELTPGYNTVTVVTRDGKKIVGVQRGYDNFSAQLMDSAEKLHSFLRSDVASMSREFRSLMPGGYGRLFTAPELDNLLAYLSSLRGQEIKP